MEATQPSSAAFFVAGGQLERDVPSYVTRQADTDLLEGLKRGEFCYVLTSRQMGKSSLMVRTTQRLRALGTAVAILDLTLYGSTSVTPEQWYYAMLRDLGQQIERLEPLVAFWKANRDIGPVNRFLQALREVALPSLETDLVLFVDEIDYVRNLPFSTDEFFAAIRACYMQREQHPEYRRLCFGLFGVASPSDLIRDPLITPFNIGKRIELRDFTAEEAGVLASGLNTGGQGGKLLERILYWTGGHPYLTQRLCQAVSEASVRKQADVDRLCSELFFAHAVATSESNLQFVSDRLLESGADKDSLLDLYGKVVRGQRIRDDETDDLCSVLRLSGVVGVVEGYLQVRNRIYGRVFNSAWIDQQTSPAEVRRQQEAYRLGVQRTLTLGGAVTLTLLSLLFYGVLQTNRANKNAEMARQNAIQANRARDAAEHTAYIASVNLIQREYENGNWGHARDLLNETRLNQFRGFEWGYWNRLCPIIFQGNTASVRSVAFSPDGKRIVTGSNDKTARVWDAQTGQETLTLKGHTDIVTSVAFSPDGKRIVTGSLDDTVRIWDAQTGQVTVTLKEHTDNGFDRVFCVAFSPDGKRIVTAGYAGMAKVWDALTGKVTLTLTGDIYNSDPFTSACFSPDGKRIVTGSTFAGPKVWDAQTGQVRLTLRGHTDEVTSIAFSPDGKRIVTGSNDKTAKVWDAQTGQETFTLKGHTDAVTSVAFSPDGKRIVTGSNDKTARVWGEQTGQETFTLKGHTSDVFAVAFSSDGKRIITGSSFSGLKVWDALTGKVTLTLEDHTDGITSVAFSPDGKHIITGSPFSGLRVWDALTGKVTLTLEANDTNGFNIYYVVSPDGKHIFSVSTSGLTKVLDSLTGTVMLTLKGYYLFSSLPSSVAFSPDGKRIVATSEDNAAGVWDAQTGQETFILRGHTNDVFAVAFSPDGNYIVTGSRDKTARVWDAQTGQVTLTLRGHTDRVYSVAFSPDGNYIVTGSLDHTAKIWDIQTGQETLTLKGHTEKITSVAFSPDGQRIVTGSEDKTARVWDAVFP